MSIRSTFPSIFTLLALLLSGCCEDAGDTPELGPPLERSRLYELLPACGDCPRLTLYRVYADPLVELRAFDIDGDYLGRALGELTPETSAMLDEHIDTLVGGQQPIGELPGDIPMDAPQVMLELPNLSLTYAQSHPPSGLGPLNALLMAIHDDLSNCQTTEQIVAEPGCEVLAWQPG